MNFNFEWYDKKIGAPVITVAKYGVSFNKGAVVKMNRPEYVMLGFDKKNQLIGIAVCDKENELKIDFISRERNGYVRINNKQFVKYVASALEDETKFDNKSIQFMGKWNEEKRIMVIDLNKPYYETGEDQEENDEEE